MRVGDSGYVVADYLHGGCNKFAIVLSDITGLKVGALFIEEPLSEVDGIWCLTHAVCMLDESTIVDAAGVRSLKEVLECYAFHETFDVFSEDCKDHIVNETLLGNYSTFAPGEKECIENFIRQHILSEIEIFKTTKGN